MDWMRTNGSRQTTWDRRPVPAQQTFRPSPDAPEGCPVEWMVAFCNETGADPWFCMPHGADDDYVRSFARLVKETLSPDRTVYLELSNEVWNTARHFPQTVYGADRGSKMTGLDDYPSYVRWYAQRSLEIWRMWEEEWGGRDRHVRVVSGFAAMPVDAEQKLRCLGLGKHADMLAIAPYAGFASEVRAGKIDLSSLVPGEILDIVEKQIGGRVSEAVAVHARLARSHGLKLGAYEAGFILADRSTRNPVIHRLAAAAARDPRNEAMMEAYLRTGFANGGGLINFFPDYGEVTPYGSFNNLGETPDEPDETAHKRRAILRVLEGS
jgi:hypothetical protein